MNMYNYMSIKFFLNNWNIQVWECLYLGSSMKCPHRPVLEGLILGAAKLVTWREGVDREDGGLITGWVHWEVPSWVGCWELGHMERRGHWGCVLSLTPPCLTVLGSRRGRTCLYHGALWLWCAVPSLTWEQGSRQIKVWNQILKVIFSRDWS